MAIRYTHLNQQERALIETRLRLGMRPAAISRVLMRANSTVTREIPRNGWLSDAKLNPVIHGKLRLVLFSLLSGVEEAEFTWLRSKTGSTDGNLGAQLLKLEEAGYVSVKKRFVQRKPQSLYRMTDAGRQALTEYVHALKQLLGGAIGD
jgi:DNA-binding HxlR family transcriptional regulator